MPAALLARMAREIENVQYAKVEAPPTAAKVSAVVKAGGIVVFGGLNGNFFIEEYHRGARGMMPGSDMIGYFVADLECAGIRAMRRRPGAYLRGFCR